MHARVMSIVAFAMLMGVAREGFAQETVPPLPTLPAPAATDSAAANGAQVSTGNRGVGIRIAKWSIAAASGGAAIYGFVANRRADDRFGRLERICVDEPERCASAPPDGPYSDPALEAEYQDVRAMDRRARTALLASQIGVASAVVLFILDLRNGSAPDNIPYEPRSFDVAPSRDGGLSMRFQLSVH